MKVKNERLYRFLRHMYKKVKVQNQGMPFRYRTVGTGRDKEVKRLESGEEYAICCPVCNETRFRLNISYVFGETIEGVQMNHVVHCWNEECDAAERLLYLYEEFCDLNEDELKPVDIESEGVSGPFSFEKVVEECQSKLMSLKGVTRVDQLPRDHPACRYLISRNFDPKVVGEYYGVGYCANDDYSFRMANKRLIIPILYGNRYVGWQARAIEGVTKLRLHKGSQGKSWPYREPKYWTSPGTRKSYFLYSYDLAAQQRDVVVMEGPTDAWRIGLSGTAALGRRISMYQRKLIAETWGDGPGQVILIGDPGFEADWRMNYELLNEEIGELGKVVLILPKDKDPGDMSREEAWGMINDHR